MWVGIFGRFPFNKKSGLKFCKFHVFSGTVHSGCTDPAQATMCLVIVLWSRIQKSGIGDNNFVKWKGLFDLTGRNDRTSQSGPPSKLVSNIPVRPNQNGLFLLMYQTKISGILGSMESAICAKFAMFENHIKPEAGNGLVLSMKGWRGTVECEDQKMEYTSLFAVLGHVTFHMIYWTPLLIKSAFVWKGILGVQDLTKYSVRFGRTQNFLTGYRTSLLLRKRDLPKSWQVLGNKLIFWDRDLFI